MKRLLLIETATDGCSVAISEDSHILVSRLITESRKQASMLAVIIDECLQEAKMKLKDLSAVAVSSGPGSYTGLRVGVSTAKGLCFGSNVPLLGIDTLEIIAQGALKSEEYPKNSIVIPMIDARRMEVYTATFSSDCEKLTETSALILDEASFTEEFAKYPAVIFAGDGSAKFKNLIENKNIHNAVFADSRLSAIDMLQPALRALDKKRFEDVAYFEPFYLKEFVAATPSKKIQEVLQLQ